jgi:putative FmdB family regulatory protein
MPRYDFECGNCGYVFEVSRSADDQSMVKCPKCKHKANKLFSPNVNFIFKGSGFYATDYKKGAGTSSCDSGECKGSSSKKGKTASKTVADT